MKRFVVAVSLVALAFVSVPRSVEVAHAGTVVENPGAPGDGYSPCSCMCLPWFNGTKICLCVCSKFPQLGAPVPGIEG